MLDAIHASGRGPNDQTVVKMLLAALEEYWQKYHMLPAPMRVINEVKPADLKAASEDFTGVIFLPDPGVAIPAAEAGALVAEAPGAYGRAGPSVDELAAGELKRRARIEKGPSAGARVAAKPKSARR